MKTAFIITGIIVGVIAIFIALGIIWYVSTSNYLVTLDANVDNAWAQVQTQYQRRADLIPNLVNTVSGAANFESSTQTKIAQLRTSAVAAQSEFANAKTQEEQQAAIAKIDEAGTQYRALNINVENYPQLNSNTNFLALQDELTNTENKVAVERMRYNDAVTAYNKAIAQIPTNFVAALAGYTKKSTFVATNSQVPTVDFK